MPDATRSQPPNLRDEVPKCSISTTTPYTPKIVPNVIEDNLADNHILACAISGKANLIVSGDRRHLLPLKDYEGIHIVRPVDFLRMLGGVIERNVVQRHRLVDNHPAPFFTLPRPMEGAQVFRPLSFHL
jgi:hypothetical protein